MRIAVLGTGTMGGPIAVRLAGAGFDVGAFDIDAGRLAAVAGITPGARAAASARDLAADADLFVTVLPGPREVLEAVTAALDVLRPGACWLDLSSNDPRVVATLAASAAKRGVLSVEAPMGGGPSDVGAGGLSFFVSGPAAAVRAAMPVLVALAEAGGIRNLGEAPGAGNTVKLLANLLWFGQSVAVTEAMLLGRALGVDTTTLGDALATSAGGSRFIDQHLGALLAGDYLEQFGIDRVVEELDTLGALAAEAGTPFALSGLVTGIHREALEEFGPVGGELLAAKLLEQRAGRPLSAGPAGAPE